VASSDQASLMPVLVKGKFDIKNLMQGMIASLELTDFTIVEMLIDGPSAAVRWRPPHQYRSNLQDRAR
jgi:hypothetical protein